MHTLFELEPLTATPAKKEKEPESIFKVDEIELHYKTKVKPSERPVIQSSHHAAQILRQAWDAENIEFIEEFKILLLNKGNKVLGVYHVSKGGITGTVADVRLILAAAIKANACCIILAHNHPSGNMKPSNADEILTRKIKEAARYFDINIFDHIILSPEADTYYSFADEGIM